LQYKRPQTKQLRALVLQAINAQRGNEIRFTRLSWGSAVRIATRADITVKTSMVIIV